MKTEKENYEIPNAHRGEVFWPIAVVVVAAGVGIAWWCFPYLTKRAGTPALQVSAQTEPDHYADRLNSIEGELGVLNRMTDIVPGSARAHGLDRAAEVEPPRICHLADVVIPT